MINKYELYEVSVQSPEVHMPLLYSIFRELRQSEPYSLREDFCGTFKACIHWIKHHPKNTAIGIDLDPEPIAYGRKTGLPLLDSNEKKRLTLLKRDVLQPIAKKSDLIIAGNFSFYIFKERAILVQYLRACLKGLSKKGLLILEMAGGPGMIEKTKERKRHRSHSGEKFTYIWDQKSFDPIQRNAHYAIHFKMADGSIRKNAFTYDWRLWTIPEVKDALLEAGFKDCAVYWETCHRGEGTGEYVRAEKGDNAFAWIAYIVGIC